MTGTRSGEPTDLWFPEGMHMDIQTQPVTADGLLGVLCSPSGSGPAPGVLLLGGSEGGLRERDARELAGQGFTVLALAYFSRPGLPPGLVDVPLEYFARGLDALAAQPRTGRRLGVIGGSRGGEAALLVGAYDNRINAVVSVVGSGVVTQGIDYRRCRLLDILGHPTNSWTWRGKALPYLPNVVSDQIRDLVAGQQPVPLGLAFPPVPDDPAQLDRISIPVERINGAVLLLSAGLDGMWPSTALSQLAADRLARFHHPYPFEHKVFGDAGHGIAGPPGQPATLTTAPGPGVTFEMGGSASATNTARAQAWNATVGFLHTQL